MDDKATKKAVPKGDDPKYHRVDVDKAPKK